MHLALGATVETSVKVKSARIDSHCNERFLHITGGAVGKVLLASVFANEPIDGLVEINESEEGVTVAAGSFKTHFKATRAHLKLTGVEL